MPFFLSGLKVKIRACWAEQLVMFGDSGLFGVRIAAIMAQQARQPVSLLLGLFNTTCRRLFAASSCRRAFVRLRGRFCTLGIYRGRRRWLGLFCQFRTNTTAAAFTTFSLNSTCDKKNMYILMNIEKHWEHLFRKIITPKSSLCCADFGAPPDKVL